MGVWTQGSRAGGLCAGALPSVEERGGHVTQGSNHRTPTLAVGEPPAEHLLPLMS